MSVVQDLRAVVAGLSRKKNAKALAEEYKNAIAVLEGTVPTTSGRFINVIADLKAVIQFEQDSRNPDSVKIQEYENAISKLANV